MRQIYLKSITRTEPATPTLITYDDKIRPGYVLVLRALGGSHTDIKIDQVVKFFVEVGKDRMYFACDTAPLRGQMVSWSGCVPVGEGCRVGMETPESEATDILELDIFGEFWNAEAWRKANG